MNNLIGNNTPIFFIREPYKFGDFIHTQKRDPKTNMRSNTTMWDFWPISSGKMLRTRIMPYADAHRYRIGVNYAGLPKPKCPLIRADP